MRIAWFIGCTFAMALAAPSHAQNVERDIRLLEETCLGRWFEPRMDVDAKRRNAKLPVYGCDGVIALQEEVDGKGPIRFFMYVPLTPFRYQPGYDPNVKPDWRMRREYTVSDPALTCRIRIAVRKYFKPGSKVTPADLRDDVGPGNPPRKNWQNDMPDECQHQIS